MESYLLSDQLTELSAAELARLIKTRRVSPVEVAEAYRARIERVNPAVNAIVTLDPGFLDRARKAGAALDRNDLVGPLHGVPFTIKDTIDTAKLRTTSGSRIRADYIPAKDATAVARLKGAGAIILGKTNTSEMAIPYETDNPVFGRTNNPYDLRRTPGGSSGGEAAAIAACLSPAGVGSDLSGSIRVPSHFCGIVGLRPTSGLIPMDGHLPPTIERLAFGACLGPMARRIEDLSLLLKVLVGEKSITTTAAKLTDGLRGCRVGWYEEDGVAPITAETKLAVHAAVEALKDAGLEPVEERPPAVQSGLRLWIELFSRASAEQMRQFYRGREAEAGPLVRRILAGVIEGKLEAHDENQRALKERDNMHQKLLEWLEDVPLIVAPVGATPAFEHGAQRLELSGESVSVFRAFSYSQTFNVFDLPSVVVRAGRSAEGLPIGIQIGGRPFSEEAILAAAAIVEEALGGWRPPAGG
ncbi:MAG: amidase [Pyrinomonadaceae bacterium]